jgi:hypothetical protein
MAVLSPIHEIPKQLVVEFEHEPEPEPEPELEAELEAVVQILYITRKKLPILRQYMLGMIFCTQTAEIQRIPDLFLGLL